MHLTIPVDVQQQEISLDDVNFYPSSEYRSTAPVVASDEQVRAVVEILKGGEQAPDYRGKRGGVLPIGRSAGESY